MGRATQRVAGSAMKSAMAWAVRLELVKEAATVAVSVRDWGYLSVN